MLAQTGISPYNAGKVERIMVVRTYPIRVGGKSGSLPGEITWEELRNKTGGYVAEPEITTVTKKQRRIANWDVDQISRSIMVTRPTGLALTFFDYWYPQLALATDPSALSKEHWAKINTIEKATGVPIKYLSTGFGSVIPLRITL
jgi:adenylosuccinate synthase